MIHNIHTVVNEPHWGILVAIYYFLVAVSSGTVIVMLTGTRLGVSLSESACKKAAYVSLVAIAISPMLLLAELMQPMRFIHLLNPMNFNPSSPLAWGGILLTVYGLTLLYFMYKRAWLGSFASAQARRETAATAECKQDWLSIGLLAVAILLALLPPAELIVVHAKAFWRSELLPVYFFTTSVLAGFAVLGLFENTQESIRRIGKNIAFLLSLSIVWIILRSISLNFGGAEEVFAFHTWWSESVFLMGEILLGIVIPLGMLHFSKFKNQTPNMLISILILVGVFAMRYVVVFIGNAAILP